MDIIDLIKQEHRKITNLLSEICKTDIQTRYTLFNQISQAINLLTEVEQQFFYPSLRQHCPDIIEQITITEDEHYRFQHLLEELELLSPASEEFEQKVYDLHTLIILYIEKKEDKVLVEADKCLTNPERQQLSHEFTKRQNF